MGAQRAKADRFRNAKRLLCPCSDNWQRSFMFVLFLSKKTAKRSRSGVFYYDVIMSQWLQTFRRIFHGLCLPDPSLTEPDGCRRSPARNHAALVPGHEMATTEWIVKMRERTCTGPYLLQRRDRESNPKPHEDAFRAQAVC